MSKFVDVASIMNVIGCVYNKPSLLEQTDKYVITDDDFPDKFHKIVFGAIYKIYELGAEKVTIKNITDFLAERPKSEAIFQKEKGAEWLLQASENASEMAFDYYYGRMKKFSLLRAFDNCGVDVNFLYDPDNILDVKKKQKQEEWLDNSSIADIANKINDKIDSIITSYVANQNSETYQAGEGILDLIDRLKEVPDVGVPLYGPLINTVTRGARLKKFYLRSGATGLGKSRTMIADFCYVACDEIYDEMFGWIKNGTAEPSLYITTELELEEVQTMMLAFLSAVNEEHIINGKYVGDEEERVKKAAEILKRSPAYVEELPDFSLQDIENVIKKSIREKDVKYFFYDYIHTSMKILEEITKRSGGIKLREDNILFMLSNKLKDICNQYGVFILSSTQLNSDYQEAETPDQNLLRGAKAIADKIDYGSILLPVKPKDIESLGTILSANTFETPVVKMSIYKNRRGQFRGIYLWCKADLGCCRVQPMFATTWGYDLVKVEDLKIKVEEDAAWQ